MKDDEGEVMIGNINEEIRNFLYPILCFIFHKADIRSTPHKKIHETFFFFESCMVVWWWWWWWWKKQWIELKILYVKMMMVEIVWRKILKSRHRAQVSCVVKKESKRSSSKDPDLVQLKVMTACSQWNLSRPSHWGHFSCN
jgi:hypothetical protein